jgi:predicted phosphoribosyltransferase
VVLVHKLGEPGNPEVAIGSIDEEGQVSLGEYARGPGITEAYLEQEQEARLRELQARRAAYTPVRPPIDPRGRPVIVVDDGLATGATMMGALRCLRKRDPARLVVAVPVAPPETLDRLRGLADEVVCLHAPSLFFAVGQFYENFSQVADEEVIRLLR